MAKATSMAELMAKNSPTIKSFKKGEKVSGKITKLHKNEILVDIGAKTEAVRDGVPPIELVDGEKLLKMFESLEFGLNPITTYEVDEEFFDQFRNKPNES